MQFIPFTVQVARGEGLVARFGDVVAHTATNDDSAAAVISALPAVARAPRAGAVLADSVGPLAFGDARGVAFGVLVPSEQGAHVLLRGRVAATVETGKGLYRLTGDSDPRWVRHLLPGAVRRAELSSGQPGAAIPRTDLRAGVVGGGGFVLLGPGGVAQEVPEHKATQRISPAAEDPATSRLGPRVPVQTASASTIAGVLVTPDGAAYLLDRGYVVGRAPLNDDAVRNATASPIVIDDDPYVSRVHAYITLSERGDEVFVRDASSGAGTFIAAPGAADWTRIGTGPTKLEPEWSMRIGRWVATYRAGDP